MAIVPQKLTWKAGLAIAVAVAFFAFIMWAFVAPRIEFADFKVDKAEEAQEDQKAVADAVQDVSNEQAALDRDVRTARETVVIQSAPSVQRETIIRERIVERAAESGDPYVSDGMQEFFEDMAE